MVIKEYSGCFSQKEFGWPATTGGVGGRDVRPGRAGNVVEIGVTGGVGRKAFTLGS